MHKKELDSASSSFVRASNEAKEKLIVLQEAQAEVDAAQNIRLQQMTARNKVWLTAGRSMLKMEKEYIAFRKTLPDKKVMANWSDYLDHGLFGPESAGLQNKENTIALNWCLREVTGICASSIKLALKYAKDPDTVENYWRKRRSK